jgi:hypothetical protein
MYSKINKSAEENKGVKRKLALTIHKKLEILVSYKKVELERYNE